MHGTCQYTAHVWSWNLLPLVIWGFCGTAAWHHFTCLPMPPPTPSPVLGFWEVVRSGTGCTSRGHSASGEEVHIVSLLRGVPADRQVILVLDPDPFSGAPIFLLHSHLPVRWTLPSPPGKNWTFQVSPGSSISAPELVASAQETNFPETSRDLLKWARREHGGVTSLAEYHGVNTIYLCLGASRGDQTAPATCKLRRNFLTSAHFASVRQQQPLKMCLNSDPSQEPEVHIIFSKGFAPKPSLSHLTVELHAGRRTPRQGLFLILKSEGAAQWIVHPYHLTGQLHVLASHKVVISSTDTDSLLTVTQCTSPGLAQAQDPLQYANGQKLPAFTSYTEAEQVNRFLLLVGMNEATLALPEDFKVLRSFFVPPPLRLAVEGEIFPTAATGVWEMSQAFLGEEVPILHPLPVITTEGMDSTLCSIEHQKPPQEKVDLQSVSCISSSSTWASSPEATMAFQDLPFHHANVLLSLEVYDSDSFAKQPGPCTVSANSRIFVEASLATYDLCVGFTICQCFISPSSDSSVTSPYLLIQHGCAVDAHVNVSESEQAVQGQALPPGYQERQRLSFVLQPRFNDSIQFLHCRLMLCSRKTQDGSQAKVPIPKCQPKNEACKGEGELASGRFQRTITKAIIVTAETPLRVTFPSQSSDNFLANQQGKALKNGIHSRKTQLAPTVTSAAVLELPAIVGIAFSAFIIGMSLTGGIWFIHSQTSDAAIRKRSQPATERGPEDETIPKPLDISSPLTAGGPAHGSQL